MAILAAPIANTASAAGGQAIGANAATIQADAAAKRAAVDNAKPAPPPSSDSLSWFNKLIQGIQQVIGFLMTLWVRFMGLLLLALVRALLWAASYSNYVSPGPTAVRVGWIVTRDLANMFFIVILLLVSFSTIIGIEKYHYQKVVPSLLITAVLINFSKTFVGLLIDLSQVVMLTFVNGFVQAAGGNFMNAMQVNKLMSMQTGTASSVLDMPGILTGYILADIMATIAVAVILVLTVHLVSRIVRLWVLIIMAPIAFLAKVAPSDGLKKMYGKWWGDLTDLLIAGPKIAFFIWLALVTAQQSGGNVAQSDGFVNSNIGGGAAQELADAQAAATGQSSGSAFPTEAGSSDTILSMIIMIVILMAGLEEAGSAPGGAGFAKAVSGKIRSYGDAAKDRVKRVGRGAAGASIGFAANKINLASSRVGASLAKTRVGATLAPQSRIALLQNKAAAARKVGNIADATRFEKEAKRWSTYSKVKGAATTAATVGFNKLPGAIAGTGAEMKHKNDEETAKRIGAVAKSLDMKDALAIVNGTKAAKNADEQIAAFKKTADSDKFDPNTATAGRFFMNGADDQTKKDFIKTMKDKQGVYFNDAGEIDNRKRDEAIANGDIEIKSLAEPAMRKMAEDVMSMGPSYFAAGGPGAGLTGLERSVNDMKKALLETTRGRKVAVEVSQAKLAEYDTKFPAGGPPAPAADQQQRRQWAEMHVAGGGSSSPAEVYNINTTTGGFNDTLKQADFESALKGLNAAKVALSVAASTIPTASTIPGAPPPIPNAVTEALVNNITKADLSRMAREVAKSGSPEQTATLSSLVKFLKARSGLPAGAGGAHNPGTRNAQETQLADLVSKAGSGFDAF